MIVADTSVWIDFLRTSTARHVDDLEVALRANDLLLLDVIVLEVLQGVRHEAHAVRIEEGFAHLPVAASLDPSLARIAARHYRSLRALGITIRKTADLIIGTYCIEHSHVLLHADRDFDPMARHLGLRTL